MINLIVFSKDRPLQLEAALRTFYEYCEDASEFHARVIYKTSSKLFEMGYYKLSLLYPDVCFEREVHFNNQVKTYSFSGTHVFFMVDDAVFIRPFSSKVINYLGDTDLGFSFRLGTSINNSYMMKRKSPPPKFTPVTDDILKFSWINQPGDWGFPLEVSSSLYPTDRIFNLLRGRYSGPNMLETHLHTNLSQCHKYPNLLFYEKSRAICIPLNKVQEVYPKNRSMLSVSYNTDSLLEFFLKGYRLDTSSLKDFTPDSVHVEFPLSPIMKPT